MGQWEMSQERQHSDPVPTTNEPRPGQEEEQAQKSWDCHGKHSNEEPSSTVAGENEAGHRSQDPKYIHGLEEISDGI